MKKFFRPLSLCIIILVMLSLLPAALADGQVFTSTDGFEYEVWQNNEDKFAVIVGYTGTETDITIPSSILHNGAEEIRVDSIVGGAFTQQVDEEYPLTSVTISDGITSIGVNAFSNCGIGSDAQHLSVQIPSSVISLGYIAYRYDEASGTNIAESALVDLNDPDNYVLCDLFDGAKAPFVWVEAGSPIETYLSWYTNTVESHNSDPANAENQKPIILYAQQETTEGGSGSTEEEPTEVEFVTRTENWDGEEVVVICGVNGEKPTRLEIPEYINELRVAVIDYQAFADWNQLETVVLPDTLAEIRTEAFAGCSSLSEINFPSGVYFIGERAFQNCSSLQEVDFPESLNHLDNSAFENCASLNTVYVNSHIGYVGNGVFNGCYTDDNHLVVYTHRDSNACDRLYEQGVHIAYKENGHRLDYIGDGRAAYVGYEGEQTEVHIDEHIGNYRVTEIADRAFEGRSDLTWVHVPGSVERIGNRAFAGVTTEDSSNFDCYISGNVNDIPDRHNYGEFGWHFLFADCVPNKVHVTTDHYSRIEEILEDYNHNQAGPENEEEHFSYWYDTPRDEATGLYYAPISSVTAILHGVDTSFENYTGEIVIPESIDGYEIVEIWPGAFQWLNGKYDEETESFTVPPLRSVVIPDTVLHIGEAAFADCEYLESVDLPDQLWEIQNDTFAACRSLTSIAIPDSVERIGSGAFDRCSSLASIDLGSGVREIGEYAFARAGLTEIVIPDSVNWVGEEAFVHCTSLASVQLSSGMWEISDRMFYGCSSLESIEIDENIERIGGEAFWNCHSLTDVYMAGPAGADANWEAFGVVTEWDEERQEDVPVEIIDEEGNPTGDIFTNVPNFSTDRNTDSMFWIEDHGWDYTIRTFTTEDGWIYCKAADNTVSLQGHVDKDSLVGDVVLPSMLDSRKVLIINGPDEQHGITSFTNCENVTSFTIPNTVKHVGSAFSNNPNLESVYFADSVVEIGPYCFENCAKLREVKLPYSLEYVAEGTFVNCVSLEEISIDGEIVAIERDAFWNCHSLWNVYLPNSLEYIGPWAFENCYSLEEIDIPASVNELGEGVFARCENLRRVGFAEEAAFDYLPYYFFGECASLSDIIIPASVRGLGEAAFAGCHSLEMLDVPASVEYFDGAYIFNDCPSLILVVEYGSPIEAWAHVHFASYILKEDGVYEPAENEYVNPGLTYKILFNKEGGNYAEITGYDPETFELLEGGELYIPDTLTIDGVAYTVDGVGAYAFSGIVDLTSVSLPASARYISVDGFAFCPNLQSVELRGESQMQVILTGAFAVDLSLSSINLPDSVIAIHEAAFTETALTSFIAPAALENLAPNAFGYCEELTTVDLSPATGLKSIGMHAFGSATKLKNVTLPAGLKELQRNVFAGCSALKQIELPDGLIALGTKAFYLSGLESIAIPESVTYIGPEAFCACRALTSVTLPSTIKALPVRMFDSCEVLESISLPEGLEVIGHAAFYDCYKLSSINIPNTVTTIGDQAFGNCESLTSLTIPASVTSIWDSAFHAFHFTKEVDENGETYDQQHDDGLMGTINLVVEAGSYAEQYAISNNIPYTTITEGTAFTPASWFSYEPYGSGIIITGYNDPNAGTESAAADVVVPKTIDNMPVVAIGAFQGNSDIRSVTLPEGIQDIVPGAFVDCVNLENIFIPESVVYIHIDEESHSFAGCNNLTITAYSGSTAHIFANDAGINCNVLANKATDFDIEVDDYSLTIAITGYHGDSRHVKIPETIEGYPVRYIGECAFCYFDEDGERIPNEDLLSVELPEGLIVIGDEAFASCTFLNNVALPGSLKEIGFGAFRNNFALEHIELPEGLQYLGEEAFNNCDGLYEITLPAGVDYIEANVLSDCDNLTVVIFSDAGTENIAHEAFAGDHNLRYIGTPNNPEDIEGFDAMEYEEQMNALFEGNWLHVKEIHDDAFYGCSSLESIHLAAGLRHIGDCAFRDCESLSSVTFHEPEAYEYDESGHLLNGIDRISDETFLRCRNLREINLPSTVQEIDHGAFAECESLEEIELYGEFERDEDGNLIYDEDDHLIPRGLVIIGNSAFAMSGLREIHIPETVYEIEMDAFLECGNLTTVTLPEDIGRIADGLFHNCHKLATINSDEYGVVNIPGGVEVIERNAFTRNAMEKIFIPAGVEYIGETAFFECGNLTELIIEEGDTDVWYDEEYDEWHGRIIDNSAFNGTGITSLYIPEGFVGLNDAAFFNCYDLTEIHLPASLQWIGDGAFYREGWNETDERTFFVTKNTHAFWWCEEREANFVCASEEITTGDLSLHYTFYDMDGETVASITGYNEEIGLPDDLVIPAFVTIGEGDEAREIPVYSITRDAFEGASIKTLSFENNAIREIEAGAFAGCENLTSVTLPETMNWLGSNAFDSCVSLESITLPYMPIYYNEHGDEEQNNAFIAEGLLANCSSLTEVILPDPEQDPNPDDEYVAITYIGEYAFENTTSLEYIRLYEGLTEIADCAFKNSNLQDLYDEDGNFVDGLTIPGSVWRIGNDAFWNNQSLHTVLITGFTHDISSGAFNNIDRSQMHFLVEHDSPAQHFCGDEIPWSYNAFTDENGISYVRWVQFHEDDHREISAVVLGFEEGRFTENVIIPDEIYGMPVTRILDGAFREPDYQDGEEGVNRITSVVIGENVHTIENNAFQNCANLSYVDLPGGLKELGSGVFSNCTSLETIGFDPENDNSNCLPGGLDRLESWTFSNCQSLKTINLPAGESTNGNGDTETFGIREIGEWCFAYSGLESINLPATIEHVANDAFNSCKNLTYANLGSNPFEWSVGMFAYCDNLNTIILPDGIPYIPDWAFEGCFNLTDIGFHNAEGEYVYGLPASVKDIRNGAFARCHRLGENGAFNFGAFTRGENNDFNYIAHNAFQECGSLTIYVDYGTYAEQWASENFWGKYILNTTFIEGDLAFALVEGSPEQTDGMRAEVTGYMGNAEYTDDASLAHVVIPDTITIDGKTYEVCGIGGHAFSHVDNLGSVSLPATTLYIGPSAFHNAGHLSNVEFRNHEDGSANNLFAISQYAFSGCHSLAEIDLPENLEQVAPYAFAYTGLTEWVHPANEIFVAESLLEGAPVEKLVLHEGITHIEDNAFSGCPLNAADVVIPSTVESIGNFAFDGAFHYNYNDADPENSGRVPTVTFATREETITDDEGNTYTDEVVNLYYIGSCAFRNTGLHEIILPGSVGELGEFVFQGSGWLQKADLSGCWLEKIPVGAFQNCHQLSDVTLNLYQHEDGDFVLRRIDPYAFEGCASLEGLALPGWMESIGTRAFANSGLVEFTVPWGVSELNRTFENCWNLTDLYLTREITRYNEALAGCDLNSMRLHVQVNSYMEDIANWLKSENDGLTIYVDGGWDEGIFSIDADENSVNYGCIYAVNTDAFRDENGNYPEAIYITIPASINVVVNEETGESIDVPVKALGYRLFADCDADFRSRLKGVTFPTSLEFIHDFAFEGCGLDGHISLPEGLQHIGDGAFKDCTYLCDITIPLSVNSIGNNAFLNCRTAYGDTVCIHAISGSHAYYYAHENGLGCNAYDNYADNFSYTIMPTKDDGSPVDYPEYVRIDGLRYDEEGNCISMTGDLRIPETIEGLPVIEINSYAFAGNPDITGVRIPDSVINIGDGAFDGCTGLNWVFLPENESFRTISFATFRDCHSLGNIDIPNNVRDIYSEAFTRCYRLNSVAFHGDSLNVIGTDAFRECENLWAIGVTENGSIIEGNILPHGIGNIPSWLFSGCHNLHSIVIPDSVGSIDTGAFENCSNLRDVSIPGSVNSIQNNAFANCHNLEYVYIPASVEWINRNAFQNCFNLREVAFETDFDDQGNVYGLRGIGENAFESCHSLQSIGLIDDGDNFLAGNVLPTSLERISSRAFRECGSLESIILPENMDELGEYAFESCGSLQTVTIGEGLEAINHAAFINDGSLHTINLPASLKRIGEYAFENCHNLRSVNFSDLVNLEEIQDGAFMNNGSLRSVYLHSSQSLYGIGEAAFSGCGQLKTVTLPEDMYRYDEEGQHMGWIGGWAFEECYRLTGTVVIPNGIDYIGESTFNNCHDLLEIIFGSDVENIERHSFQNCGNLRSISFNDGLKWIQDWAFCEAYSLDGRTVYMPATIEHIGEGAFAGVEGCMTWLGERGAIVEHIAEELGMEYQYVGGVYNEGTEEEPAIPFTYQLVRDTYYDEEQDKLIIAEKPVVEITGMTTEPIGEITIPATIQGYDVRVIGNLAFHGYAKLTKVNLPETVMKIDVDAFAHCFNLESINLPEGLRTIDLGAFEYCKSLKQIDLPDSLIRLGAYSFANADALQSVTIPAGLQYFGEGAFHGCDSLAEVILPEGLKVLGTFAFVYSGVKSVTIPASLNLVINEDSWNPEADGIGFCAFGRATELERVTFAEGVTTIADWMFEDCISLTEVIIPETVTHIGFGAFENSTGAPHALESIMLPTGLEFISGGVFDGTSVTVYTPYDGTVTATMNTLDAAGYEYLPWLTNFDQIQWANNAFSYDGTEHSVELVNVPAGVTVVYDDSEGFTASASAFGSYTAAAKLYYGERELSHHAVEPLTWSIYGGGITLDPIEDVVYDGTTNSIIVNYTLMEGLEDYAVTTNYYRLNIEDPAAEPEEIEALSAEVGSYKVVVTIYAEDGVTVYTRAEEEFSILPREIIITPDNFEVTYDGEAHGHEMTCTTGEGELVDGHNLSAALDSVTIAEMIDAGVYEGLTPIEIAITDSEDNDVTHNYSIVCNSCTMTIQPRPVTISAESITVTYSSGDETVSKTTADGLLDGHEVTNVIRNAFVNVGTHEITLWDAEITDADGNDVTGNYAITYGKPTVTITPAALTISAADNLNVVYDGKAHTAGEVTADGLKGEDKLDTASVIKTGSQNDVGETTVKLSNAVIRNGEADVTANYTITYNDATVSVTKRPITVTTTVEELTYDGQPHLPAAFEITEGTLAEGQTLGAIAFDEAAATDAGEHSFTPKATILSGNDDVTANYEITAVAADLTINQLPVTVTVGETVEYDANGHMPTKVLLDAASENELVKGHSFGAFETVETDAAVNAGLHSFNLKSVTILSGETDVTANYALSFNPGELEITQAALSIEAKDASYTYDGTAKTLSADPANFTVTGLKGEDKFQSVSMDGSQTNVGETYVAISDAVILNGEANVSANYAISCTGANVEVTAREITVTTTAETVGYTASAHLPKAVEITAGTLADGHELGAPVFVESGAVNAGEHEFTPAVAKLTILDKDGNDVASNYSITAEAAKLTITPAALTISAADNLNVVYDGKAHTAGAVTADGLKGEDKLDMASVIKTGSQTAVGETTVKLSDAVIKNGEADVTANYTITYNDATVSVTKRPITVTTTVEELTYDGQPHLPAAFEITEGTLAEGQTLGAITFDEAAATDAGEHSFTPKATVLSGNDDVTANYEITAVAADLTIKRLPVTVTVGETVEYDANGHMPTKVLLDAASENELVKGHSFGAFETVETDAAVNADLHSFNLKSVTILSGETDVTANYALSFNPGELEITQAALSIEAKDASYIYDGTEKTLSDEPADFTVTGLKGEDKLASVSTEGSQTNVGETYVAISDAVILNGEANVSANYAISYTGANVEVTAREITVTTTAETVGYIASAQLPKAIEITAGTLADGQTLGEAVFAESGAVNAGEHEFTPAVAKLTILDKEGNDVASNYSITAEAAKLTITPAALTISAADNLNVVYDGKAHTAGEITVSGLLGDDKLDMASVVKTGSQTNVGETTVKLSDAVIKNGEADVTANYTISYNDAAVSVTKRPITVTTTVEELTYDGQPHLPAAFAITEGTLAEGQTLGAIAFDEAAVTDAGEHSFTPKATVLSGNDDVTANYEITAVAADLTINQLPVTVTVGETVEYDANGHMPTKVLLDAASENELVKGHSFGAFETVETDAAVNAGLHSFNLKSVTILSGETDVTANYALSFNPGELEITQAALSIEAKNASYTYDGTEKTLSADPADFTVTGLKGEDKFASVAMTGSQTVVGSSFVEISNAVILNGETDVTANYAITCTGANVEVTAREITVTTTAETVGYTASAHLPKAVEITAGTLAEGHELGAPVFVESGAVNAGEHEFTPAVAKLTILDVEGNDVASNYSITAEAAKLTITPAALIISAADNLNVVYDGKAHTAGEITVSGLLGDDKLDMASVVKTGSQNDVGETTVKLSDAVIKNGEAIVTDNYTITYNDATVSVTKRPITVTAKDATVHYDGQPHAIESFTADNLVDGHELADVTLAEAATSEVGRHTFTPISAEIMAGETDVTANYSFSFVAGTLRITNVPDAMNLSATTISAVYGDSFRIIPVFDPAEAEYDSLTFTSSNAVVSIDPQTGLVSINSTAKVNALITVTATFDGGSLTANCIVKANENLLVTTMPAAIKTVNVEAFDGSSIQAIDLSRNEGLTIGANAFRDCSDLVRVVLPETVSFDEAGVFTSTGEGTSNAVIFCRTEDQAAYAAENGLAYVMVETR